MLKQKVAFPVGLKVKNVRWMTEDEAFNEGWEDDLSFHPVPVIEFEDGSIIYPSCDFEGNRGGAIFGLNNDGTNIYVVPLEEIEKENEN